MNRSLTVTALLSRARERAGLNECDGFNGNHGLVRGIGLLQATALNMSNMVGVGPFITIPLIIASMGGPQCMLGWVLGAILALCDGLVWSELAAAMPGTGGTYLYLREAFQKTSARRHPAVPVHLAIHL